MTTTNQTKTTTQTTSQIHSDPNYPTITSFIQKFGSEIGIGFLTFEELEEALGEGRTVPPLISTLIIRLLRRIYKSTPITKWEQTLIKFASYHDNRDGKELEKHGWRKIKIGTKLKILKNLFEAQFDFNTKFKQEVNSKSGEELRGAGWMGQDRLGRRYHFNSDATGGLRLWREDEETIELVARDVEGVKGVIQELEGGGTLGVEIEGSEGEEEEEIKMEEDIGEKNPEPPCQLKVNVEPPCRVKEESTCEPPYKVTVEPPCEDKKEPISEPPCPDDKLIVEPPCCIKREESKIEPPCGNGKEIVEPRSPVEVPVEPPCPDEEIPVEPPYPTDSQPSPQSHKVKSSDGVIILEPPCLKEEVESEPPCPLVRQESPVEPPYGVKVKVDKGGGEEDVGEIIEPPSHPDTEPPCPVEKEREEIIEPPCAVMESSKSEPPFNVDAGQPCPVEKVQSEEHPEPPLATKEDVSEPPCPISLRQDEPPCATSSPPPSPSSAPLTLTLHIRGEGAGMDCEGGGSGRRGRPRGGGANSKSKEELEVNGEGGGTSSKPEAPPPSRSSGRIAKLRIKEEEERRRREEEQLREWGEEKKKKLTLKSTQKSTPPPLKNYKPDPLTSSDEESSTPRPRKSKGKAKGLAARKPPLTLNPTPWLNQTSSSESVEEEQMGEEEEEEEDRMDQSDHEFSGEEEGEEWVVVKRARTAKRGKDATDSESSAEFDQTNCTRCGLGDHPEWILLCDKCDAGTHANCCRPVIFLIPEGNWFCAECSESTLLTTLSTHLTTYSLNLPPPEDLSKLRFDFMDILPAARNATAAAARNSKRLDTSDSYCSEPDFLTSDEEEEEEKSSANYKLRTRISTARYDLNKYDELMEDAIADDLLTEIRPGVVAPEIESSAIGRGSLDSASDDDDADAEGERDHSNPTPNAPAPVPPKQPKKRRKLNDLTDWQSDDEDGGSDFEMGRRESSNRDFDGGFPPELVALDIHEKLGGSGSDDQSDEDQGSSGTVESSDSEVKRRRDRVAVRRSRRKRRTRRIVYDSEDEEESDDGPISAPSDQSEGESASSGSSSDWRKSSGRKARGLVANRSVFPGNRQATSLKNKRKRGGKKGKRGEEWAEGGGDKPWSGGRGGGSKSKKSGQGAGESTLRTTRGKKINFKRILEDDESEPEEEEEEPEEEEPIVKRKRISSSSSSSSGPEDPPPVPAPPYPPPPPRPKVKPDVVLTQPAPDPPCLSLTDEPPFGIIPPAPPCLILTPPEPPCPPQLFAVKSRPSFSSVSSFGSGRHRVAHQRAELVGVGGMTPSRRGPPTSLQRLPLIGPRIRLGAGPTPMPLPSPPQEPIRFDLYRETRPPPGPMALSGPGPGVQGQQQFEIHGRVPPSPWVSSVAHSLPPPLHSMATAHRPNGSGSGVPNHHHNPNHPNPFQPTHHHHHHFEMFPTSMSRGASDNTIGILAPLVVVDPPIIQPLAPISSPPSPPPPAIGKVESVEVSSAPLISSTAPISSGTVSAIAPNRSAAPSGGSGEFTGLVSYFNFSLEREDEED